MVELTSDTEDRVRALVRLDGFGDAYLFVGRFVDPKVLSYMERTQTMVAEYQRLQGERSGIQITFGADLRGRGAAAAARGGLGRAGFANQPGDADQPADHGRRPGPRRRSAARVPEDGPDSDEIVL